MVSALWNACSEGDLSTVLDLLKEATPEDIEIKDQNGVTPLIEAVKNSHADVVKALLNKGADPANACSQGRPEMFASEPAIMEMLSAAANKSASTHHNGTPNGVSIPHHAPPQQYPQQFMMPPGDYAYYPPGAPPMMSDMNGYFMGPPPPPPSGDQQWGTGPGSLPPAETARLIPCRYYPDCRYGASCMFAHPPQVPQPPAFYPGAPLSPQGHFAGPAAHPYDPAYGPHAYYPMPPQSFVPPPNGVPPPHMISLPPQNPTSPPDSNSLPFPTNNIPHLPYGAGSPMAGNYPGPVLNVINRNSDRSHSTLQMTNGIHRSPTAHSGDGYSPSPEFRDSLTHQRRPSARTTRTSVNRKPPCLFFPTGKCKNGDDCRFPHVLPDGPASPSHSFTGFSRGGPPRRGGIPNGIPTRSLEDKMANMNLNGNGHVHLNGGPRPFNGNGYHRGGFKGHMAGPRPTNGKPHLPPKQPLPSADDFPVLNGSVNSPSRSPKANGVEGLPNGAPTAAQVLQAPAPIRRESSKDVSSDTPLLNGTDRSSEISEGPSKATPDLATVKPTISFAAVANGINGNHEVSVTA